MTNDPKKKLTIKEMYDEITKEIEISYPRIIIINNGIPAKVLNDEEEMLIRSRIFKRRLIS